MVDTDNAITPRNQINLVLTKLAEALGCSPGSFLEPPAGETGQTYELLRLWLSIEDPQERQAVLMHVRRAADAARG